MSKTKVKALEWARYIGEGYILGVPARDLSPDEYEKYKRTIALAAGTRIYEVVTVEEEPEEAKDAR